MKKPSKTLLDICQNLYRALVSRGSGGWVVDYWIFFQWYFSWFTLLISASAVFLEFSLRMIIISLSQNLSTVLSWVNITMIDHLPFIINCRRPIFCAGNESGDKSLQTQSNVCLVSSIWLQSRETSFHL